MKTAVIILFHGSTAPGWSEAPARLADEVRAKGGVEIVMAAYLQHLQPDFSHAVATCSVWGVDAIVVVPFFMQTGSHVASDIPALVEAQKKRFPAVQFTVTDHVGSHPLMATIVHELASAAKTGR